jgi:dTDP-4-amino-4,6-dideoxygalactose transaminase
MKVPMIDLSRTHQALFSELRLAMDRVLSTSGFILGPEVEALEAEVAAFCSVRHGVGVGSGTDALLATLMALDVGPGDEVIVPAFTFFATAGVVARVGARPVFVDIEPDTFNMDPSAMQAALTERTRAIIPVHLFGQCADMDRILPAAEKRGVPVIEDTAQAIAATCRGRPACSFGKAAALSFYPTKNLSAIGEGGMVLTDDEELAATLRCVRNHGQGKQYEHHRIGGNFRLDGLQGAALRVKLRRLPEWTQMRRELACRYDGGLADSSVTPPPVRPECVHVYHQYTVRSPRRDALRAHLNEAGIGAGVFYPIPLPHQPCFAYLGHRQGEFPVAERATAEVLSLPVFPGMTRQEQDYVMETIRSFS